MEQRQYPRRRLVPGKAISHVDDRPLSEALTSYLHRLSRAADAVVAAIEQDAPAGSDEEETQQAAEPEPCTDSEERPSQSAERLDLEALS